MPKEIMLDIETLNNTQSSVIVSIGAVVFDFEKEGVKSSFDVTFDLDGTCKWSIEKGDFIEPDFIEQSDVDIIIDIKEFWSEEIEVDLTTEVKNLLIEKIKTQLYEF